MATYTQKIISPRYDGENNVVAWAVGYDITEGDIVAYAETLLFTFDDNLKPLSDWTDQERDTFVRINLEYIGWLDTDANPSGYFLEKLERLKLAKLSV
jgi:hypothetical protein